MDWKTPPIIKVYEAYGCIGDCRIMVKASSAKVYSSSLGKYYSVTWDGKNAIMCNDNASYWKGYLGYPAIAFLCLVGMLPYSHSACQALKDIPWKDINQKNNNDFDKTMADVEKLVASRGIIFEHVRSDVEATYGALQASSFQMFGEKKKPPQGY